MASQVVAHRMLTTKRAEALRFAAMAAAHAERIGARMRERREELGLSQGAVARALPGKVDGNQVSRWERGAHRPHDETLERIAGILEVDMSYFMAPKPKTGTPDLMGTFNGNRSQLDRIEAKLDGLIEALSSLEEDPRDAIRRRLAEAVQQDERHPDSKPVDGSSQRPADEVS